MMPLIDEMSCLSRRRFKLLAKAIATVRHSSVLTQSLGMLGDSRPSGTVEAVHAERWSHEMSDLAVLNAQSKAGRLRGTHAVPQVYRPFR